MSVPSHARARRLGAALARGVAGCDAHIAAAAPRARGVLPSGCDALDAALGVGGYPEGRLTVLHGPEACGKSTLALHAAAECQRAGGVVLYLDFEHKLDEPYAAALGVDLGALVVATPPHIERAFALLEQACAKLAEGDGEPTPVLLVWDSLHAAVGRRTFEADWEKEHFSPEARAYSLGLARFVPTLSRTRAVLLAISQVRMKLDGYMPAEKVGVGRAPLFYASVIVKLRAKRARGTVRREGELVEAVVVKNQVAPPYRVVNFPMVYGRGVDGPGAVLEAARLTGLAVPAKAAGWWDLAFDGESVRVQGAGGVGRMAEREPESYARLRAAIRAASLGPTLPAPAEPSPAGGEGDADDAGGADG